MARFGVGQGLRRVEDERLLLGAGRYSDDLDLDNALHGFVLRSPLAHAEIAGIDLAAAKTAPGVAAVYTIEDLDAAGIGPNPCVAPVAGKNGSDTVMPPRPLLARGRVRHVGEPVAFVVAATLNQARDAAEAILVDYRELPAVTETAAALHPDAPQIWDEAPGNLAVDYELGDKKATDAAFARAVRRVALELINNRLVVNAMEPRAALASVDAQSGRLTLHTSSQGSHSLRSLLKTILKIPGRQLRVVTPDVGGGFGMKLFVYAEQALVLFAARQLGRAVRWTGERGESFLSDSQGRDHVSRVELALDSEGRILALRSSTVANLGAYLSNFSPYVATNGAKMTSGLYRIPAIYGEVKAVFTNTVPVDAYRGAGRPEAAYLVERLIDYAAREIGLEPAELRRRNFIPPDALPYTTPTGLTYDSGDYAEVMRRALEIADLGGLAARKAAARRNGRLRGLGFASYVEACAGVGKEVARVALDPDGGITLTIGTQTNGQGHATAYAQLLHEKLGLDPALIRTRQGDTDALSYGHGTGGSRSLLMGGSAALKAAEQVIARARSLAGRLLEAAEADLELKDGRFTVIGTDKRIDWATLARESHADGAEKIDETAEFSGPPLTYPNGCHVCELEVEEASGEIAIVRYLAVDDFGKVVNPLLAAGQVTGGVAQGIGQALHERTVYDPESGQLVTGSLMDYCLPRADDLPPIEVIFAEDWPCVTNDMGVKGAGEAGSIGAPPAVINALCDALKPLGVRHIDMPATPERVWRAIQDAKAS